MRHDMNGRIASSARIVEPVHHALAKLRQTLATMRASVLQIIGPCIEQRTIDAVPCAAFPCAEVDFLEARIGVRITQRSRKQKASLQRTRMPRANARRHLQHAHPLQEPARRFIGIARKRHVGLPIADARIDSDSGMAYQDEIHPSPVR